MFTDNVKMRLRNVATSSESSAKWIEYTSTLPFSGDLLARIKANPLVDELYQPMDTNGRTTPRTVLAITTRPGAVYRTAELALAKVITDWYEEHCGATDIYRTLEFTFDSVNMPELIMQPNRKSPRAQYGYYMVKKAIADTIGEGHVIRVYDYLLVDLASQIGMPRPDTSK